MYYYCLAYIYIWIIGSSAIPTPTHLNRNKSLNFNYGRKFENIASPNNESHNTVKYSDNIMYNRSIPEELEKTITFLQLPSNNTITSVTNDDIKYNSQTNSESKINIITPSRKISSYKIKLLIEEQTTPKPVIFDNLLFSPGNIDYDTDISEETDESAAQNKEINYENMLELDAQNKKSHMQFMHSNSSENQSINPSTVPDPEEINKNNINETHINENETSENSTNDNELINKIYGSTSDCTETSRYILDSDGNIKCENKPSNITDETNSNNENAIQSEKKQSVLDYVNIAPLLEKRMDEINQYFSEDVVSNTSANLPQIDDSYNSDSILNIITDHPFYDIETIQESREKNYSKRRHFSEHSGGFLIPRNVSKIQLNLNIIDYPNDDGNKTHFFIYFDISEPAEANRNDLTIKNHVFISNINNQTINTTNDEEQFQDGHIPPPPLLIDTDNDENYEDQKYIVHQNNYGEEKQTLDDEFNAVFSTNNVTTSDSLNNSTEADDLKELDTHENSQLPNKEQEKQQIIVTNDEHILEKENKKKNTDVDNSNTDTEMDNSVTKNSSSKSEDTVANIENVTTNKTFKTEFAVGRNHKQDGEVQNETYVIRDTNLDNPILLLEEDRFSNGSYHFNYKSADGSTRTEVGHIQSDGSIVQIGKYSYRDPKERLHEVEYQADSLGYRITNHQVMEEEQTISQ